MKNEQYDRLDLHTKRGQGVYRGSINLIRDNCGSWPRFPENLYRDTRYPNLVIELAPLNAERIAKAARVRLSTLVNAVERGATLSRCQLSKLADTLEIGSEYVNVAYLSDPCLAVVDPSTAVGAAQKARLGALLEDAEGLVSPRVEKSARIRYDGLCSGEVVLYASYRSYIYLLSKAKPPSGNKPKTKYPIDIDRCMESMRKDCQDKDVVEGLRVIAELMNHVYSLGKGGKRIPANAIVELQHVATVAGRYDMCFSLMRWVSEAYAQGRRSAAKGG